MFPNLKIRIKIWISIRFRIKVDKTYKLEKNLTPYKTLLLKLLQFC